MTNWLDDLNSYLANNLKLFGALIGSTLGIIVILFFCSLIHVLRGTRHTFIIFMNIAVILDCLVYAFHVYAQYKKWKIS